MLAGFHELTIGGSGTTNPKRKGKLWPTAIPVRRSAQARKVAYLDLQGERVISKNIQSSTFDD